MMSKLCIHAGLLLLACTAFTSDRTERRAWCIVICTQFLWNGLPVRYHNCKSPALHCGEGYSQHPRLGCFWFQGLSNESSWKLQWRRLTLVSSIRADACVCGAGTCSCLSMLVCRRLGVRDGSRCLLPCHSQMLNLPQVHPRHSSDSICCKVVAPNWYAFELYPADAVKATNEGAC